MLWFTHIVGITGVALRCIGSGDRLRDKLAVTLLLARYPFYPLGSWARRRGWSLPDPGLLLGTYRCRVDGLVYECPAGQGAYFLGANAEPRLAELLRQLESGTFVDIGANVGFMALPAAKALSARGHVVAIEPHPVRYMHLRQNAQLNGLTNVTCLPYAAADRPGRLVLHDLDPSLGPHPLDVSILGSGPGIEVEARTVDDLLAELEVPPPGLVKIDVEGFEPAVLRGLRRTLHAFSPSVVFEALDLDAMHASAAVLESLDYSIVPLDDHSYLAKRS